MTLTDEQLQKLAKGRGAGGQRETPMNRIYGLTELPGPVLRCVVIVALLLFWVCLIAAIAKGCA